MILHNDRSQIGGVTGLARKLSVIRLVRMADSSRAAAPPATAHALLTFTESSGYIMQCSITPAIAPAVMCVTEFWVGRVS